jgi:2-hydroxychromene-2-carboxylate isomerase
MSSPVGKKNARQDPPLVRAKEIDFWFTMGSTYSYLTVMRLAEVESLTGVGFRWRPFHLLTLLQEMKHIPFADKPAKAAYMWRDIERRAQRHGIPVSVPAPYPVKQSIVANRIALFGLQEGWGRDFIRAAYRRWLVLGQETGSELNVSESLEEIGQTPARVLDAVNTERICRLLEVETDEARRLGIFGSPTFVVEHELFWGDDRLDDALEWYRYRSLRQRL